MDAKESFKILTQLIKEGSNFDEKNFDLVTMLAPTEAEQKRIRDQLKKSDFYSLSGFGKLCETLVEYAIFPHIERELMKLFQKVHNNNFVYKTKNDESPLQVVKVIYKYYFHYEFYIITEPHDLYYKWDKAKGIKANIEVDYDHTEEQLEKLLNFLKVDYSEYKENYDYLWVEEIRDIEYRFENLVIKCWNTNKQEANSRLIGFMLEGTGISDNLNLDNKEAANTYENIVNYVKGKGVKIKPIKNKF